MKSALLWYELYISKLAVLGFELNPYDRCVANKILNGKQCTVCVDDNKISHEDPAVVSNVIKKIESFFGKMVVTRGREHDFLGAKLRFCNNRTVAISMVEQCKEAIAAFTEPIQKKANTPARNDLFTIDDTSPRLRKERSDVFHRVVMKLAFITKRSRPDLEPAMGFLQMRVSKSTAQDWEKLRRVLEFLNGTLEDELVLGAENIQFLLSYVDASFAVHLDMKSHTGGATTFGRGIIILKSTKQKLNTRSSTDAEIVGALDYLPDTIWLLHFLKHQGYEIDKSQFFQDNKSAIKIQQKGEESGSRRTRHLDICYFFMKDLFEQANIKVRNCKTEEILGDFFTKPLQGALDIHSCRIG